MIMIGTPILSRESVGRMCHAASLSWYYDNKHNYDNNNNNNNSNNSNNHNHNNNNDSKSTP